MNGPSPERRHPLEGIERVGFLKNFVTRPNIEIGDYTYYDDPRGPERFEENVLYHFDFIGDRLIVGRFCSIAAETRFIMNGGNHATTWFTTYPFPIFGNGWEAAQPDSWPEQGRHGGRARRVDRLRGDGHARGHDRERCDRLATGSMVTRDVEPFAIVAGNPAGLVRHRFDEPTRHALLEIAWWDWSADKITRNVRAICSGDLAALRAAR